MIKKFTAILLAVFMVMSMLAISVSAAEVEDSESAADVTSESTGTSGKIYFDASKWNNVSQVYCHLWINGGESFYGWKAAQQKCTNVSGSLWEYDLSILDQSTTVTGGLKADEDYCLIFHADTGVQGYDTTFTTACIGDRAYMTGETIENPMDSNKLGYETVWSKNASTHGPHFAISSIGNFLGEFTCPHESSTKIIGNWLIAYSGSQYCDPVEVLVGAMKRFKIDDASELEDIYAYILDNCANSISDPDTMKAQLEEAYNTINPPAEIPENPTTAPTTAATSSGGGNKTDTGVSPTDENGNPDPSGTGADGQNDTIFLVLSGVMLLAVGVLVATRKKREF